MGVTIDYVTKTEISDDVRGSIIAALREPDDQPWLLCEPISFFDMPGFEDRLFGASKLNLIPHPDDRAEAESYDAEKDDLTFLLDKLCQWSSDFGVDWSIQIEGSAIGEIVSAECEPRVRDAIEAMVDVADELGELGEFL